MRLKIDFHMISDEDEVTASIQDQVGSFRLFLYPKVGDLVEVGDASGCWMKATVEKADGDHFDLKVLWNTFVNEQENVSLQSGYQVLNTFRYRKAETRHSMADKNRPRPEASLPMVEIG